MWRDIDSPKNQIKLLTIFSAGFWFSISGSVIAASFMLQELQASPAELSLTVTFGIILAMICDLPTSAIADKYGRRFVLVIATVLGIVGTVLAAISVHFLVFLVASMVLSLRKALREGVLEAMLYDQVQAGGYQEKYHYIMSRYGILSMVGPMCGPFIGGLLAQQVGVRGVFWIELIPMAVLLIGALFLIREPKVHYQKSKLRLDKHICQTFSRIFSSPPLKYFFVFNLFLWAYATTFNSYSSLYFVTLGFSPVILGALGTCNGIAIMLGHIAFRNTTVKPSAPMYWLLITLVLAMLVQHPILSPALFLVQAVLIGGLTAVFDRERQLVIPDDIRSTVLSAFGLSVQVVFIPLSFAFGFLANQSVRIAFIVIGASAIVGLIALSLRHKRMLKQATT